MDVIVLKKKDKIEFYFNGSKLIIDKFNKLFDELNNLSDEELIKYYKNLHKRG